MVCTLDMEETVDLKISTNNFIFYRYRGIKAKMAVQQVKEKYSLSLL